MRAILLAFLVLPLLPLTGCLTDGDGELAGGSPEVTFEVLPGEGPPPPPDDRTYWIVWVHGNETRERLQGPGTPQPMCMETPWRHVVDPVDRSLEYSGDRYQVDNQTVQVVLAVDHDRHYPSCRFTATLQADPQQPTPHPMGELGRLTFQVHENGTVVVDDDHAVPPGEVGELTYSTVKTKMEGGELETIYRYKGTVQIELLGAWPRAKLVAR